MVKDEWVCVLVKVWDSELASQAEDRREEPPRELLLPTVIPGDLTSILPSSQPSGTHYG